MNNPRINHYQAIYTAHMIRAMEAIIPIAIERAKTDEQTYNNCKEAIKWIANNQHIQDVPMLIIIAKEEIEKKYGLGKMLVGL